MLNARDILETITMIQDEHLDVRTITMGISLLDCCHSDVDVMCGKVYDKITVKVIRDGKEEIIYLVSGGKIIDVETLKEVKLKDIEKGKNVVLVGKYDGEDFYASIISVY